MKGIVTKPLIALLIIATIFLSSTAIPAMAQQDISAQPTNQESSDPEANLPYLFAVYTITWIVFFAYLYYLSQRQRNLRREVEELRQILAEKESQSQAP
ncbi:MAG: CcmD family protein [Chloroflexi bacterium]|nr:CcmD family protein [Chloroflexota bacterium]